MMSLLLFLGVGACLSHYSCAACPPHVRRRLGIPHTSQLVVPCIGGSHMHQCVTPMECGGIRWHSVWPWFCSVLGLPEVVEPVRRSWWGQRLAAGMSFPCRSPIRSSGLGR